MKTPKNEIYFTRLIFHFEKHSDDSDCFRIEEEHLGLFTHNAKTFTRPGRRIRHDKFCYIELCVKKETTYFGYLCPWFHMIVPTRGIDKYAPKGMEFANNYARALRQAYRDMK